MSAEKGHPGLWGPGMEPEPVRKECEEWMKTHPAPEPRPIVPARAYRPRRTR
jgi:hypothetical protein